MRLSFNFWQSGGKKQTVLPKPVFGQVREDASIEVDVIKQMPQVEKVCIIASAGCTVFSLAMTNSHTDIYALDINAGQIHLCKLKETILKKASVQEIQLTLEESALPAFEKYKDDLEAQTKEYWQSHITLLKNGLNQVGMVDERMALLMRWFYLFGKSKKECQSFLQKSDTIEQQQLFEKEWSLKLLPWITNIMLSRPILKRIYGEENIARIPQNFSAYIWDKVRKWFISFPAKQNPYLWQTFLQRYASWEDEALPFYLQKTPINTFKKQASKIHWIAESMLIWLKKQPDDSIDFFGLSNIQEALNNMEMQELLREVYRTATSKAIIVIRHIFLNPENIVPANLFTLNAQLSQQYSQLDRSGICNGVKIYRKAKH